VSVAVTYAEALYESAVDQGSVAEVAAQLADFRASVDESAELSDLLTNPEFETRVKKDVVGRLLRDANPLVANFVQILLDRGRAAELGAITDAFAARVAVAEGRLRVRIRTAIPLPPDLRERLIAQLSERVGRAIDVDTVVDEDIMGGVVIETEGSVVDASVRTRLAGLRASMLRAPVRDAVVADSA